MESYLLFLGIDMFYYTEISAICNPSRKMAAKNRLPAAA